MILDMPIIRDNKSSYSISEVFTPRSKDFNSKIYVPRSDLEIPLIRSINGSKHSVLIGESGNGKSWLYKKVFKEKGVEYVAVNCANISRNNSVSSAIVDVLIPDGHAIKSSYTEKMSTGLNAVIAKADLEHVGSFSIKREEPLLAALSYFLKNNDKDKVVIVFDNFERIFENTTLVNELADIVILLDDEKYSVFKLLIVGTISNVMDYFGRVRTLNSVANRLQELPRVASLNLSQVESLIKTGMVTLLKFSLTDEVVKKISKHIYRVTLGVAQCVHEYGEHLAYLIEDAGGNYSENLLGKADHQWLREGLSHSYSVIEGNLNARRTEIGRKNQVIYAIGKISGHQFSKEDIESIIREEFPMKSREGDMGIASILGELSSSDEPLVSKNPKTNDFMIVNPRHIMCIRAMLYKETDESVNKRIFRI